MFASGAGEQMESWASCTPLATPLLRLISKAVCFTPMTPLSYLTQRAYNHTAGEDHKDKANKKEISFSFHSAPHWTFLAWAASIHAETVSINETDPEAEAGKTRWGKVRTSYVKRTKCVCTAQCADTALPVEDIRETAGICAWRLRFDVRVANSRYMSLKWHFKSSVHRSGNVKHCSVHAGIKFSPFTRTDIHMKVSLLLFIF